jgi:hypothetical protein
MNILLLPQIFRSSPFWLLFIIYLSVGKSQAAPLDALLSANTPPGFSGYLETSLDLMNSTVDVLNIRGSDPVYGGTTVGDYDGDHLRAGLGLSRLWLEGSYWRRNMLYRNDNFALTSSHMAGQFKLLEGGKESLSLGLRWSAWSNDTGILKKSSPTFIQDRTVQTINIVNPRDSQRSWDLIASYPVTEQIELSGFAGTGRSSVSVDSLNASYVNSTGCLYNMFFENNGIYGALAAPCATANILNFSIGGPGSNMVQELNYTATFQQAGGSLKWSNQNWLVHGGYQFQQLSRDQVDEVIVSRGGKTYTNNHIVVGHIERKVFTHARVFMRGQIMSNQFVGEIPFSYNSFTAAKFNKKYGFASFGVKLEF